MSSRFGTIGTPCARVTLKSDQEPAIVDVLRGDRESSWGSWNADKAVAGCRFTGRTGSLSAGIRSVEEMTRVILVDLSSRVGSPISVHSPAFPWIAEHATDILNKCHGE